MSEAASCLRCGSRLPEEEEGLCPTCGTPFGARTMAISVGADELKRAHETAQSQRPPSAPAPPVVAAEPAAPTGLLKVIVGVVAALVVVLILVVWRLMAG